MSDRQLKIMYYSNGKKVWGLNAYTFFWLPVLVLSALSTLWSYFTEWDGDSVRFIISLGAVLLGVFALITIGSVDKWSFYSNLAFLSLFSARIIIDVIYVFMAAAELNQAANAAVDQMDASVGSLPYFDAISGFVSSSFSAGVGIGTFITVMSGLISLLLLAVFFYIFSKNKRLFFTPMKDLKHEYE